MTVQDVALQGTEPTAERGRVKSQALTAVGIVLDILSLGACGVFAGRLKSGMDVSFDLLSYHYLYSWAFFHGNEHLLNPEPFANRYINPAAEFPWYLLDQAFSPRVSTTLIAIVAGLNLVLLRRAAVHLVADRLGETMAVVASAGALVIAGGGAVFKSELGTSLADVIVSIPTAGAVLLLVRAARFRTRSPWPYAIAGALAGISLGLKLTMAPYVVGTVIAVLALCVVWRTVRPLVSVVLGSVAGVAIGGGWWMIYIWRLTGNPVFPYYNSIFRASGFSTTGNFHDTHFGPHGIVDALKYPLYMWEGTHRLLDVPLRDSRWVIIIVLIAAATAACVVHRARGARRMPEPALVMAILFVIPALLWLKQFGIARYAVLTEMLVGPMALLCVTVIATALPRALHVPIRAVALGLAALTIAGGLGMTAVTAGHFQHAPFAKSRLQIDAAPLRAIPSDAVVLVDAKYAPSGFLLPSLPAGVRRHVVHPAFYGSGTLEQLERTQLSSARSIFVIEAPWAVKRHWAQVSLRRNVGIDLQASRCVTVHSIANRLLCPAVWARGRG